jgi:hypothetical protein
MDYTDQSMRVSVVEEHGGRVVVDGSTEDRDERNVHLDSVELSSSRSYIIKYEFFEKNVARAGSEDKTISGAHMVATACSKPFVVQELAIMAKALMVERAEKYRSGPVSPEESSTGESEEHDISQLPTNCDFTTLDNRQAEPERGERGLYCTRAIYSYSLAGQSPRELNTIFEKKFTVAGAANESVTYLFDLTLRFDFAASAQLKALLRRVDPEADQEYVYDPLACLYDHSCVETE